MLTISVKEPKSFNQFFQRNYQQEDLKEMVKDEFQEQKEIFLKRQRSILALRENFSIVPFIEVDPKNFH